LLHNVEGPRPGEELQHVDDLIGARRPGEQVTLGGAAPEPHQAPGLFGRLHTLDDRLDAQRVAHRDDRRDERFRGPRVAVGHVGDEALVDLQDVDR